MLYYQNLIGQKNIHSLKNIKQCANKNRGSIDLIGLDNNSITRPGRFLKNLGRSPTGINPTRAKLIEFITRITDTLDRGKSLDQKHIYSTYPPRNQSL